MKTWSVVIVNLGGKGVGSIGFIEIRKVCDVYTTFTPLLPNWTHHHWPGVHRFYAVL